mgnify:CR=1 FL=1
MFDILLIIVAYIGTTKEPSLGSLAQPLLSLNAQWSITYRSTSWKYNYIYYIFEDIQHLKFQMSLAIMIWIATTASQGLKFKTFLIFVTLDVQPPSHKHVTQFE